MSQARQTVILMRVGSANRWNAHALERKCEKASGAMDQRHSGTWQTDWRDFHRQRLAKEENQPVNLKRRLERYLPRNLLRFVRSRR